MKLEIIPDGSLARMDAVCIAVRLSLHHGPLIEESEQTSVAARLVRLASESAGFPQATLTQTLGEIP
ncbi:hypothetical protein [Paraburkholderia xenovorans]|uniref:hypothetical protein n=1 Tax=Paraburkholderia xenovorans TaxID=36873 RepID=UPI0038BA4441